MTSNLKTFIAISFWNVFFWIKVLQYYLQNHFSRNCYLGILWWQLGPKWLNTTVTFILWSRKYPSSWPKSMTLFWSLNQLFEIVTLDEPRVTSMRPSWHECRVLWSSQTLEEETNRIASPSMGPRLWIIPSGPITSPGGWDRQPWIRSPWMMTLFTWRYKFHY